MNDNLKKRLMNDGASHAGRLLSEAGWHWLVGIANMLLILAVFVLAVARASSNAKSNNMSCLQQVANAEHASLEAFFQNPAQQDALVQAMRICSR